MAEPLPLREPAPSVRAEDPDPTVPRGWRRARAVVAQLAWAALLAPIGLALWPPYLLARIARPRPPLLAPPGRFLHVARRILAATVPPPGRDALDRGRLLLDLGVTFCLAPAQGLAWMLDEVLFARALAAHPVEAPLFEISAWRSGSTRLAHLLHHDPGLAAPAMAQLVLPYLWAWRLARLLLGGRVDPAAITRRVKASLPPAFVERHEVDPFRTDTYDVLFFRHQLVPYALMLGPAEALAEFSHRGITPSTRALWEDDFVRMLDGLGRRALVFAGPGPDGRPRRFFLKGHFLAAAPALAARWPDARFVAVVRPPLPRLRSAANYLRLSPDFFGMGPMPWPWIAAMLAGEIEYDRNERGWFGRDDGVRRCVIPFDTFVRDLPRALEALYATCLDRGVPPEVPRAHAEARHAGPYLVDHPLEALGVDEAAVLAALAGPDGLRASAPG